MIHYNPNILEFKGLIEEILSSLLVSLMDQCDIVQQLLV
jgi:hypothetical protein